MRTGFHALSESQTVEIRRDNTAAEALRRSALDDSRRAEVRRGNSEARALSRSMLDDINVDGQKFGNLIETRINNAPGLHPAASGGIMLPALIPLQSSHLVFSGIEIVKYVASRYKFDFYAVIFANEDDG
jgi:hypothetical protein